MNRWAWSLSMWVWPDWAAAVCGERARLLHSGCESWFPWVLTATDERFHSCSLNLSTRLRSILINSHVTTHGSHKCRTNNLVSPLNCLVCGLSIGEMKRRCSNICCAYLVMSHTTTPTCCPRPLLLPCVFFFFSYSKKLPRIDFVKFLEAVDSKLWGMLS